MIKISPKFVPKGLLNNTPALAHLMTWRRWGDKPLSEPMMVRLQTHTCVTRPQWVKICIFWYVKIFSHKYLWMHWYRVRRLRVIKYIMCITWYPWSTVTLNLHEINRLSRFSTYSFTEFQVYKGTLWNWCMRNTWSSVRYLEPSNPTWPPQNLPRPWCCPSMGPQELERILSVAS